MVFKNQQALKIGRQIITLKYGQRYRKLICLHLGTEWHKYVLFDFEW